MYGMKRYLVGVVVLLLCLAPTLRAHLNPDDSLDEIERKLTANPDDVPLLLDKAHVLIVLGQGDKAAATLKHVDALEKERSADTAYLYILLYHKRGELKKAFERSDWGIQQFPENPFQWEIRGRIAQETGRTDEAIHAMRQSLRYRETVNPLNYIQIVTLLLEGNHADSKERTLELLREGIARVDHPSELLHLSIRLNSELARYDQALADMDALETHYGKQVPFAAKRAEILEDAGRNAEAANAYRSAIALLEARPPEKQNAQVTHLMNVFQSAVDELSDKPDEQPAGEKERDSR